VRALPSRCCYRAAVHNAGALLRAARHNRGAALRYVAWRASLPHRHNARCCIARVVSAVRLAGDGGGAAGTFVACAALAALGIRRIGGATHGEIRMHRVQTCFQGAPDGNKHISCSLRLRLKHFAAYYSSGGAPLRILLSSPGVVVD
jgi:hypothetical protein